MHGVQYMVNLSPTILDERVVVACVCLTTVHDDSNKVKHHNTTLIRLSAVIINGTAIGVAGSNVGISDRTVCSAIAPWRCKSLYCVWCHVEFKRKLWITGKLH